MVCVIRLLVVVVCCLGCGACGVVFDVLVLVHCVCGCVCCLLDVYVCV